MTHNMILKNGHYFFSFQSSSSIDEYAILIILISDHCVKALCLKLIDQELISVRALVFDLAQLTCQKRFDCRNAIIRSSKTFLDTS